MRVTIAILTGVLAGMLLYASLVLLLQNAIERSVNHQIEQLEQSPRVPGVRKVYASWI